MIRVHDMERKTSPGRCQIAFWTEDVRELDQIIAKHNGKALRVDFRPVEEGKKRSLNANKLLWHCIGEIAKSVGADKWKVYLMALRRYGKFTYLCAKPEAVEDIKKEWREVEVLGPLTINGKKATQLLCYFGSSSYTKKEFSQLLDGVISEMKEMRLETPDEEHIREAIEQWEKKYGGQ